MSFADEIASNIEAYGGLIYKFKGDELVKAAFQEILSLYHVKEILGDQPAEFILPIAQYFQHDNLSDLNIIFSYEPGCEQEVAYTFFVRHNKEGNMIKVQFEGESYKIQYPGSLIDKYEEYGKNKILILAILSINNYIHEQSSEQ